MLKYEKINHRNVFHYPAAAETLAYKQPENSTARRLYENAGFVYCENRYRGDEIVMMHQPPMTNL